MEDVRSQCRTARAQIKALGLKAHKTVMCLKGCIVDACLEDGPEGSAKQQLAAGLADLQEGSSLLRLPSASSFSLQTLLLDPAGPSQRSMEHLPYVKRKARRQIYVSTNASMNMLGHGHDLPSKRVQGRDGTQRSAARRFLGR